MKDIGESIAMWLSTTIGNGKSVASGVIGSIDQAAHAYRWPPSQSIVASLLVVVLLLLSALSGKAAFASPVDIWIQTPTEWEDRESNLGRDLIKQVVAPGGVAVIEVYGARGNNPGLQTIADAMEKGMLDRGATYLQTRISESRRATQDGHDAIFREYSGLYNGIPLQALAIYTFGNGGAVAAFGFYAETGGNHYRAAIWTSIGSLRFTPPGGGQVASGSNIQDQSMSSTLSAVLESGGGKVNLAHPKCAPILGTWRSEKGDRTIVVTADGHLNGNPKYTWSCHPDGTRYRFRWDDGARTSVWDDLRMDRDGKHLTWWQAGTVWGRFVKVHDTLPVAAESGGGKVNLAHPKCAPILGTWRSEKGDRTIVVTADGHLNGNPKYTWSCHPDGTRYGFRWVDGSRTHVWDDLRMDRDGKHLTWWQAGTVWGRFVKVHDTPPAAAQSEGGTVKPVNPKCTPILGTWRSEKGDRTIVVTADGHLNGNPKYTWSCHPDGTRYRFRWDDGSRTHVWDDLRMDRDGKHLTWWQAGTVWGRFVKVN